MSKFETLYQQHEQSIQKMITYLKDNQSRVPEIFEGLGKK